MGWDGLGWAGMGWEWLVISSCNDMVPWIYKQVVIVISVWYSNGSDGMIGNVFVVNFNHFETHDTLYTSSTAQGGGGSFKNRKPLGEVGCCESGMAEQSH